MKASSTFAAVLADVSMKMRPCSRAKASPSSLFTSRRASRSLRKIKIFVIHVLSDHEKCQCGKHDYCDIMLR